MEKTYSYFRFVGNSCFAYFLNERIYEGEICKPSHDKHVFFSSNDTIY